MKMLKPRPVTVTLEILTDVPLAELRDRKAWNVGVCDLFDAYETVKVRQVHVAVVQPAPKADGEAVANG